MEDERKILQEIFLDDFEAWMSTLRRGFVQEFMQSQHLAKARFDPRDGLPSWRIALPSHGLTLIVKLQSDYPDCEVSPEPGFDFHGEWPAGGDAFAKRMSAELMATWVSGECCLFQWADYVREAMSGDPPELTGATLNSGACVGKDSTVDAVCDPGAGASAGSCAVPLADSDIRCVGASLEAAGFAACGPSVFSHGDRGVTVELLGGQLSVTVDGIDAEDLSDWTSMQLAADASSLGARLVEWVTAQRSAEPGFLEGDGSQTDTEGVEFLPTPEELSVDTGRDLLVYTWGKALRKAAPQDSEHNFNAGILNGRGGGADLRTMNGLSDEVQNNVASCNLFPRWISMVCAKVEHSNCKTISINCTKGRHRSVAAAELLRKVYYPKAVVRHLTIY